MLNEALDLAAPVLGEMAIASVRGRASRRQIISWAERLRRAASMLEEAARAH